MVSLAAFLLVNISCSNLTISDIGKGAGLLAKASHKFTEEEEYYIGRAVAANVLSKYTLYKNVRATAYLNKVGNYLVINSNRPQIFNGYHFALLNTREINAWTTPGGVIFITRGLFNLTENEDELAAVIAHEIAHCVVKDPLKAIKSNRLQKFGAFVAGRTIKDQLGSSEVINILNGCVVDITGTLLVRGYSRKIERKADLMALSILRRAGYNANSLRTVLKRLLKFQKDRKDIFSTHPRTGKRLEIINAELKNKKFRKIPRIRVTRFKRIKALIK